MYVGEVGEQNKTIGFKIYYYMNQIHVYYHFIIHNIVIFLSYFHLVYSYAMAKNKHVFKVNIQINTWLEQANEDNIHNKDEIQLL